MNQIKILFEDTDIVAIDKPACMVVNEAKTAPGLTIQAWIAKRLIDDGLAQFSQEDKDKSGFVSLVDKDKWQGLVPPDFDGEYGSPEEIFGQRWGIVHRLDKDTSGVLVLAKNPGALVNLLAQFKQRQTQKEYLALVHGQVDPDRGVLSFPLGRSKSNFKKITVVADGRMAETSYSVIEKLPLTDGLVDKLMGRVGELNHFSQAQLADIRKQMNKTYQQGFSWVKCLPKTGRMHQIRVHMNAINHPLVGDPLYLGRKRLKLDRLWTEGQVLSAVKLKIKHPRTGEAIDVVLDTTLNNFWK